MNIFFYDIKKVNITENIISLSRNNKCCVENAIHILMDMYISSEMFEELSILLDIQYEYYKLNQLLITLYFKQFTNFEI